MGYLLCYNILTQHGTVISRLTVQRITTLEKMTPLIKETLRKFDDFINTKLKCINRGYIGNKLNPED